MGPKQMPIKSLAINRDFLHKIKLGVVVAFLQVAIEHILTRLHSRQTSLLPCLPPMYFMTITFSLQVFHFCCRLQAWLQRSCLKDAPPDASSYKPTVLSPSAPQHSLPQQVNRSLFADNRFVVNSSVRQVRSWRFCKRQNNIISFTCYNHSIHCCS